MKLTIAVPSALVLVLACAFVSPVRTKGPQAQPQDGSMQHAVVVTYAEWPPQVQSAYRLTESLRAFGGAWRDVPVWLYVPSDHPVEDPELLAKLRSLGAEVRTSETPAVARWFFYGGKPFAAATAELAAEGEARLLVWLDDDTIVLDEPGEFDLDASISLAYCPVMHNRSGTLFGAEPNPFWARIYERLSLADDQLFPMVTPADEQRIRAYFHCGQYAVRPEKGVLRRWARDFETLCRDSVLVAMCREDRNNRVFLHQTALTSAILHKLGRSEMRELSDRYNYPIFFERQYGGVNAYNTIENAVTIRDLVPLTEKVGADWAAQLAGPADRVAWLKERLQ